jgi:hypothetical protein
MSMKVITSLTLLAGVYFSLALVGGQGTLLHAQASYKEIRVDGGGTIRGMVRLVGDVSRAGTMEVTKDDKICGRRKPSCRLSVGKNNGVQNAVICLEGITQGKKMSSEEKFTMNQRKCEYVPHVMILPAGAPMEIVNSDPIMHNVHTYDLLHELKTVYNIAQPIKGQCTPIKPTMLKCPGLMFQTCDAGHPWMSAYVIVAEHPYYALTDANGKFVLTNVPPGSYQLRMWHEGVIIARTELEHGLPKKFYFEDPYEVRKEVAVQPSGEVAVDFDLALR